MHKKCKLFCNTGIKTEGSPERGFFCRSRLFPRLERQKEILRKPFSCNTDYDKKPKLIPGKQRSARRRRETEDPDKNLMRKAQKNG